MIEQEAQKIMLNDLQALGQPTMRIEFAEGTYSLSMQHDGREVSNLLKLKFVYAALCALFSDAIPMKACFLTALHSLAHVVAMLHQARDATSTK